MQTTDIFKLQAELNALKAERDGLVPMAKLALDKFRTFWGAADSEFRISSDPPDTEAEAVDKWLEKLAGEDAK
jgi:hypothetical protein